MSPPENLNPRVRVRYVSPPQPVITPNDFPPRGRVIIGELPDIVLLNIFRYYLDVSSQHWPRLVHICRRWRCIVFNSLQTLHLQLFCTHGTPVSKTLGCWPTLPIAVRYGGYLELDPPAPEDEDNIIAALKQSGRVSSISLTLTNSLLEKLSSIKGLRPFSELEDLVLLSRLGDGMLLTLFAAFLRGPPLRRLHLTRIALPGLLQLLHSSTNLVEFQVHEVFDSWLSPEALTNALSGMAQLQSLSFHFLPTMNYRFVRQSSGRVFLPVLTRLDFRGNSRCWERLVARIDAPRLGDIEITISNEDIGPFPGLRQFISRIEIHKLHRQARILSSDRAISITLTQPAPACLKLQLSCEPLRAQLLFMRIVCDRLSASLLNVEDLRISTTRQSGWVDGDYSGWRDGLNSFTSVRQFHVAGNLSTDIVRSLPFKLQIPPYYWDKTVIPSMHTLYIAQPGPWHSPLREAVVETMVSRRLSGHPIAVEYERLCNINESCGTGPPSRQVTIEMLSDDIFLNIFRDYLDGAPRTWPTLTYVCQRWRQIVHTSPLGLNLRLYCTYRTPVLKSLDCWPTLPIVVQYGGLPDLDPPSPEDDDNIIAALKQSDRVNAISLTVTGSLFGKLSAISEPCSELEELVLQSRDNMQLTLPSTFRWGPHLRTLHSTRIAFPSLPQLLSHSHDLVDIQLHEIPSAGYFSPEAFANALSGITNLRTLSLHFLSLPSRRNYISLPPPSGERVVLLALMFLKYRGTSKYLDSLVARIDAPSLGDIDITFFSQPTMDASQLGRFIERTGVQTPLSQAEVQTSGDAISISFTSSGTSTPLRLQISCKQLDWQLSSMAQVCDQFSPFLSHVNHLRINSTRSSSEQDDADGGQWLELIRAFGGATDFPIAGELTIAILCALGLVEDGNTIVLPSLRHLRIENPTAMNEPSWDGLLSFIALRLRSGHPVQVNVPFKLCHICYAGFREQKGLNHHLVDKHSRVLCSYCRDFECRPGDEGLFRDHIRRTHPDVAVKDDHVWKYDSLTPDQLDSLVTRHSFLETPETSASSIMVRASHFTPNRNPMVMNDSQWDGLLPFITLQSRSGHPVQVNVTFDQCHICHASFREKEELYRHLADKHRRICSYCRDFECRPGQNRLFRDHLRRTHPEVAHDDNLVWKYYALTPDQLDGLITRHSFLDTPDPVAPSTTLTAPPSQ
ncbi:hypothetical protein EDB92DRAFT_1468393 [Lactarius akahatsu]|uniref:C2H2-type domain-containing protein n=1 Tax=Lactarius akahatsu TaxID=416441 RepID=A0AAD4L8S5_9AGAM|nr:hypothetical protein EDB92DRAFT_1468393 [Lactarius akahatsu]